MLAYQDENGKWKTRPLTELEREQVAPLTNDQIRELRQQAYNEETDEMLKALSSYQLRGNHEKYNELYPIWLAKIEEINNRYPYNDV